MIEAYALLAAFTVQILAMSVLVPAWFIRNFRRRATNIPAERFAQLLPTVDRNVVVSRIVTICRVLNAAIVVLGLFALGSLVNSITERPAWDHSTAKAVVSAYLMAQILPLILAAYVGFRINKLFRQSSLEGKRKATLRRRGLFDFVSPFVVLIAVLAYFLFAAFAIYFWLHPFPKFSGHVTLMILTLVYAFEAFVAYRALYGRKSNPFETHEGHVYKIGVTVRACVCASLALVAYFSLDLTLAALELTSWKPFAVSVYATVNAIGILIGLSAPPRRPEADDLGSDARLTPGTRDLSA